MNSEDLQKATELLVEKNDVANEKNRELMVEVEHLQSQLNAALEREQALAAHVERLRDAINEATDKHIGFAKRIMQGCDSTAMAAVDKADALLVRASYYAPIDVSCLTKRDLIKQAEALESAEEKLATCSSGEIYSKDILSIAKDLRQQAAAL